MISREKAEKYSSEPSLFLRIVFKLFMQRMIKKAAKKGYYGIPVSIRRICIDGILGKLLVKYNSGSMLMICTLMQVDALRSKGYEVSRVINTDNVSVYNKVSATSPIIHIWWREDK